MSKPLPVAKLADSQVVLLPAMANRHGLITGATGTGKTVTLQLLTERFSSIGVPVFLADVKGDLSGLAAPGAESPKMRQRLQLLGVPAPEWASFPVTFWDVFGEAGLPIRATITDLGPLLLSRILQLNEVQQGVLALTFKAADDEGLLLLDLKDLRAALQYVSENAKEFSKRYGNVSAASIGAIQRGLLALEQEGAEAFFGEPALAINDLMRVGPEGRGVINVLAADRLLHSPRLYAVFLLWVLGELFEQLPEVGDLEKPKLVFFFDEAHLLFDDAPKPLMERVERVVRLIRSKGVGVYFVTQNPRDVPEDVLGQLGNRVQHALRAYTPRDRKAVKAAAETMRPNPKIDAARAITELQVGEALLSMLDSQGSPTVLDRGYVLPPASRIGPIDEAERRRLIASCVLKPRYETAVDRDSAYEALKARTEARLPENAPPPEESDGDGNDRTRAMRQAERELEEAENELRRGRKAPARPTSGGFFDGLGRVLFGTTGPRGGHKEGVAEAAAKSAARSVGSSLGRSITRGVLGSLFGRR